MSADDSTEIPLADPADDPRVAALLEEYLHELEAGRTPDREAYLRRHPELAVTVANCLEALEMVHGGARGSDSVAGVSAVRRAASALPSPGDPTASGTPAPLGDFQIVREIARGGMGVVYEAVQLSLGRRVALKVLPFAATFDSRQLQRFKNEAQAAALLHHNHIVPIYAVGCERGVHFYAMQLIEGQSLAIVIQQLREKELPAPRESNLAGDATDALPQSRGAPLSSQTLRSTVDISATLTSGSSRQTDGYIRRAARLMVQAAEALEHAHQEGVVHRDIKPGNLMLDAAGRLWITDFGLAQLHAENGLTRSGDLLGTFRYMSPEQTSGQRTMLDHRTDIYSLGATFYELLALEPVFGGETHQELLYQILHTEPRSLRERNKAVPPELETIILKSLSKNPADRYRTAGEFAADIQRFLTDQPILARRPSLFERGRKWLRRHPSVAIAGAVVLMTITMLSLVNGKMLHDEQQRTKEALGREQARATEAEQRFLQARHAVDALFEISEEELGDKPMDSARKRILEVVLSHYQEFIDQRQGDPASQAELALVQAKVKNILRELNVLQRDMHTRLLREPVVQSELKVTSQQQNELSDLLSEWEAKRRELFEPDNMDDETERRAKLVAIAEELEGELGELLAAEQLARFKQLTIQSQGLFAFKEPEIVKALELTADQRAAIREIERDLFELQMRSRPSFDGGGRGREDIGPPEDRRPEERGPGGPRGSGLGFHPRREPPLHLRPEAVAQAVALLDERQTAKWREMTGEPLPDIVRFGFPFPGRPR